MFWVENSISSTLLGWDNRCLQDKAHGRNQEFQLEMERARYITDDENMKEDLAFKRRLVALTREQRQEVSRQSNFFLYRRNEGFFIRRIVAYQKVIISQT